MGGGQVCLKWNSFHSSLAAGFKTLWEEDGLVDVTLASDGQCIQAHKLILSACSPFFREVFKANPCQHPVIILQDTHFTELESLLCFVYKGEVNIEQENLPALLRAAETLQIRGLSGASEQVQNELGGVGNPLEIEEVALDDAAPAKRSKTDNRQSPTSPRTRQPQYSRTKKGTSNRMCSRNVPASVETVLESQLSPERIPKLEPVDHDIDADSQTASVLSGTTVEEQIDSNAALFLGPVMDMKVHQDSRISAADTGQNKGYMDESAYHVEQNLQSLESNQVFNCLTSSRKDNPFPPFPCPFCERAYTSWGFRRRHIKAMHTQTERLSCKWCLQVMETHADWKSHVSTDHGLSQADANNGILILDEANMVLRIPNPPRLETLVTMIRANAAAVLESPNDDHVKGPQNRYERDELDIQKMEEDNCKKNEVEGKKRGAPRMDEDCCDKEEHYGDQNELLRNIKKERQDSP